jgi:hypothetical protein
MSAVLRTPADDAELAEIMAVDARVKLELAELRLDRAIKRLDVSRALVAEDELAVVLATHDRDALHCRLARLQRQAQGRAA